MGRKNYSVDLIKQMAECDANYIRLLKLMPALKVHRERAYPLPEPAASPASAGASHSAEPEKMLEGMFRRFSIASLEGSGEKVTVEIRILEAFKYTATLELSQRPECEAWMTNPSMIVRAYHDANTAEVIAYQGHQNFKPRYPLPNPDMYHPDEKMQVNSFLGEWLSQCLSHGQSLEVPQIAEVSG